MGDDLASAQGRTSNPCCAVLEKKHKKLLGKCYKLEEIRKEFRKCMALVRGKYDVVEKENGSLKRELEELKVQADKWKAQKEKEYGCCVDLDDEVSALKGEIRMLKELLEKERQRAAMEETERKKSAEALEEEKKKVIEANKVANVHRKSAGENRLLLEKLKTENKSLKDLLASERSKVEAAEKKVEDGVSTLKEEIQECLIVSEKQIKHLRELLDIEWKGAAMEINNAGSEKKNSVEALKEVEVEKKKASEAEKVANVERKKAEESRLLWEKLKTENDALRAMLAYDISKTGALDKKVEAEKQKTIAESKRAALAEAKSKENFMLAEMNLKKAMFEMGRADALKQNLQEARIQAEKLELNEHSLKSMLASERSKTEAAEKKLKEEKVKAIAERKRADLVEAKSKEKFELMEMDLKKAMVEKDRADDLNRKLDEARVNAEKLEEFNKRLCSEKSVWAQPDKSKTGESADLSSDAFVGMPEEDAQLSKRMLKILLEKEDIINQEKKCALSAKKKAEKQKRLAKEHKHKSDQLFNELQSYKLRLKELQELQELVSRNADNASLRFNEAITESDTVKLPKKRLMLEKMLVKHDSETAKVEAVQRLRESSSRELVPLPKRRKTANEGVINIHCLQDYGMPKSIIISGNDKPGDNVMIFEGGNGGQKEILDHIIEWLGAYRENQNRDKAWSSRHDHLHTQYENFYTQQQERDTYQRNFEELNTRVGTVEKENTQLRADMVVMDTYHRGRYDLLQQRYDGMHTSEYHGICGRGELAALGEASEGVDDSVPEPHDHLSRDAFLS